MKLTQKQKDALKKIEKWWGTPKNVDENGVYFDGGYMDPPEGDFYSWRKIYKMANCDAYPWKGSVKHFSKRKNRNATNQNIHRENYDIFHERKSVKTEDIWAWD